MEKVRFGIIGCGNIAARFAKALERSPAAELYACAAREQARAEEFASQHKAVKAYGSYEELLADEKVQAVYIATVHTTHAQIAQACILAGKAVLCEKPFFTGGKEAEETIALAREKDVLVMEGFWTRTQPAYLKAKEWLKEGKIGDVRLIRAAFCFNMPLNEQTKTHRLWDPAVAGGALLDAGVYPYEYVTGIMDGPPQKVTATVQTAPTGVDATVTMAMTYPYAVADCLTSICGYMDGAAVISGTEGFIKQHHFIGSRKAELFDRKGTLVDNFEDAEEEGFVHEIVHFADLFRSGRKESPYIPLEDTLDFARRVQEILGE